MNLLTSSWDNYTKLSFFEEYMTDVDLNDPAIIYRFRETNQESYSMYREISQIVDALCMAHESLNFNGGMLVAGAIYIILCINLQLFMKKEVVKYFSRGSIYLLDNEINFNNVYKRFVDVCFGIDIEELIPYVQYCSKFFGMKMDHSIIEALKNDKLYQ
jgi:hypothetical protein